MAEVYRVEAPLLAFRFISTGEGNNFKALEKEVAAVGGTVAPQGSDVVVIRVKGKTITLTLGFGCVVGSNGEVKTMSVGKLDEQYVEAAGVDAGSLVKRVDALEVMVKALQAEKGKANKAEKEK